jgi:hypothetical protein
VIERIISGGQTGADRAALDVAIEFGIPHGGWIPKGRKTEDGRFPAKYQLQEMSTAECPRRTEQNVIDSDGTLIISHGELSGGSDYTRRMAEKHGKPWIHLDADKFSVEAAVEIIRAWLSGNDIEVLNVAGPSASKDPKIFEATKKLLTLLIQDLFPKTLDAAVKIILTEMRLKDKAKIANTEEAALSGLHMPLGKFIRRRFGLWSGNRDLLESCAKAARKDKIHEDEASALIIREVWKKLRETHSLRAVK